MITAVRVVINNDNGWRETDAFDDDIIIGHSHGDYYIIN